jgi:acetyl esterase/lipase
MTLDFSQYGGPSEEWLAVEKTLPALTFDIEADPVALRSAVNTERENRTAAAMAELSAHVDITDYSIPTRDGSSVQARTYRSIKTNKSDKLPVFLYFHGGGFIFGSLESEDATCTLTAIRTGVIVFHVNYRHTPEHTFPTAWHDAEDAFAWLHKNIDQVGGDSSKVVVGGVSAGGQLSAALTLEQHLGKSDVTKDLPKLAGQVLIIPCLASISNYDEGPGKKLKVSSYVENEHAPILPRKTVEFFMGLLKIGKVDLKDTKLNIVNASEEEVKGLPPTVFGIAGLDPLRDEGLLYAKLLTEANVPTEVRLFKGVPHGHRRFGDQLKKASKDWDDCVEEGISWVLSRPQATGKFEIKLP